MISRIIDAIGFIRTGVRRIIFIYVRFHGDAIRVVDDGVEYWIRLEQVTPETPVEETHVP